MFNWYAFIDEIKQRIIRLKVRQGLLTSVGHMHAKDHAVCT